MGKYLELFRGEVGDLTEKTKLENKPYVAYSTKLGKVTYTVVPAKDPVVEGPADNEIWYTTSDGSYIHFKDAFYQVDQDNWVNLAEAVSQETYNGKNIAKFPSNNIYPIYIDFMMEGWLDEIDTQKLTSIHIPSTFILPSDFLHGASNLESVILDGPCGIFMGDYTGQSHFSDCTSLKSFTIPLNSTIIHFDCFGGCSSLTSIVIPGGVESIGQDVFSGTGMYNDNSNWENDVLYIDNYLIKAKESISGTYTIKENTRLIADNAFAGCSSLTSIVIPDGVTSIGESTFSNCSSLTSIVIPDSVTSIGGQAFRECPLTSITIPNSVTSIGGQAFLYCSSLTSIAFEGTMKEWNSITKEYEWNYRVPATYVQCSDGQVEL